MRITLLLSLLLLSSTALADQAYMQANAWTVNRLPIMPGQAPHQRCLLQTTFSGNASIQFIAENQHVRGVILIVTEPTFKEDGQNIDVTLYLGKKGYEFPARTISKYAVAVEISDAYEAEFRKALGEAKLLTVKTGFKSFVFTLQPAADVLQDALACTPPVPTPAPAPVPVPAAMTTTTNETVFIRGEQNKMAPTVPSTPQAYMVPAKGVNVPLGDALSRILPPGYTPVFSQGASPGEKISWEGGRDWLETLIIALDDVNLQAAVTGRIVTVLPKIRPTTLAVTSTAPDVKPRANVIVKEPMAVMDPSKPPSPGMKTEADALLNNLRLDQAELERISKGPDMAPEPDTIPLPAKPDTVIESKSVTTTVSTDKAVPVPAEMAKAPEPAITADMPAAVAPDVFAAQKGETVSAVLSRWGKQSNTPLSLDLQRDYFVAKDMTVQGDLDLAVSQLFKQFDDLPEKPRFDDKNSKEASPAPAVGPLPRPEPTQVEERLGLVAGWNAVQGTSLRAALTNWTRQAQMTLVWESPDDVVIANNVTGTRRLEDALDALLSQYDKAPQKPSIQINRDPDTNVFSMIVDVQPFAVEGKPKPASKKK